jgi:hypothetical protein
MWTAAIENPRHHFISFPEFSLTPETLALTLMACSNSPLGTPRERYDEHSSKSSLSYETKV